MPPKLTTAVRRAILGLAVAALLVPATASARIVTDVTAAPPQAQDLRSPDARDAAEGRYLSPTSSLAGTSSLAPSPARPAPAHADDGLDWASVGIGAAMFGGLVIAGFGVASVVRVRPRAAS